MEGGLYDDGMGAVDGAGMVLVNNRRLALSNVHSVDSAAGRFSPSGAVGLAGHMENYFLATYLRDFNRIVPLTTESSVTEGMLEVLSPTVSSRGLSQASPIPQPESRRQAKLAVFWGVVAMGSRILKAQDEATARYLSQMRASLRECFDSNDKEVGDDARDLETVHVLVGKYMKCPYVCEFEARRPPSVSRCRNPWIFPALFRGLSRMSIRLHHRVDVRIPRSTCCLLPGEGETFGVADLRVGVRSCSCHGFNSSTRDSLIVDNPSSSPGGVFLSAFELSVSTAPSTLFRSWRQIAVAGTSYVLAAKWFPEGIC